jgi:hypothetical protein
MKEKEKEKETVMMETLLEGVVKLDSAVSGDFLDRREVEGCARIEIAYTALIICRRCRT